jgi:carbamoyltransferase
MDKNNKFQSNFHIDLPAGSILGINYSGMHDSSIAIVTPEGKPVFAVSLERLSRVKQDGRTLDYLLRSIPWDRIDKVAISTPKELSNQVSRKSSILSNLLPNERLPATLAHGDLFYKNLNNIPCEKVFVGHQEAHASSAFWGSGFNDSICLTYDGGMLNDMYFGGVFVCNKRDGILPVDLFDATLYSKVSTLYTFITALLGFKPMRHEGKVTGLAAFGVPTDRCFALIQKWFDNDYYELENCIRWENIYDRHYPPRLVAVDESISVFRAQIGDISREEMAATIQAFTEMHILQILTKARQLGWVSPNICLAGGLFSNVKINQKVIESGYDKLFVAPPMTDEGTALGAAWHIISGTEKFIPKPLHSVFLGPSYSQVNIKDTLDKKNIIYVASENPAKSISRLLAQGSIVAVFQKAAEFGPRSLGNRSILAQATDNTLNQRLNDKLKRTEFMPFAPMTRAEDADLCYHGIESVRHAAEFMVVTVNCTESMKELCPAVVHIDGTARPQLVNASICPFMHQILTEYKKETGKLAIVNTSFNVHEEPIVCSIDDALRGFFESGLDYLYVEGIGLIAFSDNQEIALEYLREKISSLDLEHESMLNYNARIIDSHRKTIVAMDEDVREMRALLIERTERLEIANQELLDRTLRLEEVIRHLGEIYRISSL